jgi:dipeptidyl aminopeptidase/acylaminoacyl peptidase
LPSWSPDNGKIAFVTTRDEGIDEIYTMNANGSSQTRITNNFAIDTAPRWSPDGTKIVFESDRDDGNHEIYTMDPNGNSQTRVTNNAGYDSAPDWRPIPVNNYVRPAGASPVRASLVPAYTACTAPNRAHGTPLASPSCFPPALISNELTVGTFDVNGKNSSSTGFVKYNVVAGDPGTPTIDEADVRLTIQVRDVWTRATMTEYDGELNLNTSIRRTDKENTPQPGGNGAATVAFHVLYASIPCTPTAAAPGATCNLTTTFDALYPGIVREGKRAIWGLGQVQIQDGGADHDANTVGDNALFMVQGVFVP